MNLSLWPCTLLALWGEGRWEGPQQGPLKWGPGQEPFVPKYKVLLDVGLTFGTLTGAELSTKVKLWVSKAKRMK